MDLSGVVQAQLIESDWNRAHPDRKRSAAAKRQTIERKQVRAWKAAQR